MLSKKQIGKIGEDAVKIFLQKKGMNFLHANFFCRLGEIDLIFMDQENNQTIFVEVKTRTSLNYGLAEEAFDQKKLERMQNAIDLYLAEYAENDNYRIDLAAVYVDLYSRKANIKYYKNVY